MDEKEVRCPCAPMFSMCEYESYESVGCTLRRLNYMINEIKRSIPLAGRFIKEYHCYMFQPKHEEDKTE